MKPSRLPHLLVLVLAALLAGCSGAPDWIQGEWIFDADRSQREMQIPAPTANQDLLDGMAALLGNAFMAQLKDMKLTITRNQETEIFRGRQKSVPYQVINKSATECTLQQPDGTMETYHRDGAEIYIYGNGAVSSIKAYFRRKS